MAVFGQVARTPTEDANEGIVNPPSIRNFAAAGQSQNVKASDGVEQAVLGLGATLGNELAKRVKSNVDNINEQRVLDAGIRQGNDNAINAIDANKKRVGWEKYMFGEDIEYRAAQQRAVDNNVNQAYLEQMNKVDEFAGDDGEQYASRLKTSLDDMLAPFEGDVETRDLITGKWTAVSEQLAAKHGKAHYAHKQVEGRRIEGQRIKGTFDRINLETQQNTEQAEHERTAKVVQALFNYGDKPDGMTNEAYRSTLNEELNINLREGNIGMHNAAKAQGWYNDLNQREQVALNTAVHKYDTIANQKMAQSVSQVVTSAGNVSSQEELDALMKEALVAMESHSERSSDTELYGKNFQAASKNMMKALEKAENALVEAEAEQNEQEDLKASITLAANGRPDRLLASSATKTQLESAEMSRLEDKVSEITGKDDMTLDQAIREISANPDVVAPQVAAMWGASPVGTDVVKTIGTSMVNSFDSPLMRDEDGQPTELAMNTMKSLNIFETENRAKLRKEMGTQKFAEYQIIKEMQGNAATTDMIQRELDSFREGVGQESYWATDWGHLDKNQSKRDYVTQLVQNEIGSYPRGRDIAGYMEVYGTALKRSKGDHNEAQRALQDSLKNGSEFYQGHQIDGGAEISAQLPNYALPEILDNMQNPELNMFMPLVSAGMSNPVNSQGGAIRNMQELGGRLEITVDPRGEGIIVNHRKFSQPVFMTVDKLRDVDAAASQLRKQKQLEFTAIKKAGQQTRPVSESVKKEIDKFTRGRTKLKAQTEKANSFSQTQRRG